MINLNKRTIHLNKSNKESLIEVLDAKINEKDINCKQDDEI